MTGDHRAIVFVSYSRKDLEAAARLREALAAARFEVSLDIHDIAFGEPWRDRLAGMIEAADSLVFLISPDSVASVVCDWEVNHAELLGKPVIPVVLRRVAREHIPPRLRRLNFVHMRDEAEYAANLPRLVEALATDLAWTREKTRLNRAALAWEAAGEPARMLILNTEALAAAERWRSLQPPGAPPPTALQNRFVDASRAWATRRQRRLSAMLGAVAVVIAGLGLWATYQQRIAARERDQALVTQSRFLADRAAESIAMGDHPRAMMLALAGLPDGSLGSEGTPRAIRPYVAAAERYLHEAWSGNRELAVLRFGGGPVVQAAFSPDGTSIAGLLDSGEVRLRGAGAEQILPSPGGRGISLAFAPDGLTLAVSYGRGGQGPRIRFWDLGAPSPVATELFHPWPVSSLDFSLDGERLLGATRDGGPAGVEDTVIGWDRDTGARLLRLPGHGSLVRMAAYGGDDRRIVGVTDKGVTHEWRAANGELVNMVGASSGGVLSATLDSTGERVVYGLSNGTAEVCRVIDTIGDGPPVFGANGTIMSASYPCLATLGREGGAGIWSVAVSPDGETALTASEDGIARLWRLGTGELLDELAGHEAELRSVAFDASGTRAVTASADGTARLWAVEAERHPVRRFWSGRAQRPVFSADAARLAVVLGGEVHVYDVATGERVAAVEPAGGTVNALALSADGTRLALSGDKGHVAVHPVGGDGEPVVLARTGPAITTLAFDRPGTRLAMGARKETAAQAAVIVVDIASGARVMTGGHDDSVEALAFDLAGDTLASAASDGTIHLRDARTGALVGRHAGRGPLAFSPDGAWLAAAGLDRTATLLSVKGDETRPLQGHGGPLQAVLFSPDGTRLATADRSRVLRHWVTATGEEVAAFDGIAAFALGMSPDGDNLLSVSVSGEIGAWPVFPGTAALIEAVRRDVPRCLSAAARAAAHLPGPLPDWCARHALNPHEGDLR